jgi:hypothetical protein
MKRGVKTIMDKQEYDMKYTYYDYCRTDMKYKDYSDCWEAAIVRDYVRLREESLKNEQAIIKLAEEERIANLALNKFAFWSEIITIIIFIIFVLIKIIQLS